MTTQQDNKSGGDYWRLYRAFDLLRAQHQTLYDQVKTADQKAGYICTFLTILLAVSKGQGNVLVFLNTPPSWSLIWILSLAFAAAAAFSVICTALVVLPRVTATATSFYWGYWTNGEGLKMERLLQDDLDEFVMSEYLRDIQNLARIAQAKYRYVTRAFRGTAVTILCYFAIVLSNL
jgi:hypothetical protein